MKKSIALTLTTLIATSALLVGCSPSEETPETPSNPTSSSSPSTSAPTNDVTETVTLTTLDGKFEVNVDKKVGEEWKQVASGQYQLEDQLFAQIVVQQEALLANIKTDTDIDAYFGGFVSGFTDPATTQFPPILETSGVLRDADNHPYIVTELGEEGTGSYFLITKLIGDRSIAVVISPLDENVTTGTDWVEAFSTVV